MAKKPDTKTYKVRSRIRMDGEFYEVGTTIDLTDAQAAELSSCGAIDPQPEKPAAPTGEGAPNKKPDTGDKD
jgi:hypothetical protein